MSDTLCTARRSTGVNVFGARAGRLSWLPVQGSFITEVLARGKCVRRCSSSFIAAERGISLVIDPLHSFVFKGEWRQRPHAGAPLGLTVAPADTSEPRCSRMSHASTPKYGPMMSEANGHRLPLAVIILTLNEERHLPECLASVAGLAERTLIVDSGSTDETVNIARQIGVEIVFNHFNGYASQRTAALTMVAQEWVLFLDADERLTPNLRHELAQMIAQAPPELAGYWIPRRNVMFGRELHGGGWWPDHQLRLLRRSKARYAPGREVHEIVELDGPARTLEEPMLHLNYETFDEFRSKQLRYCDLRAEELVGDGLRPRRRSYIGRPAREFWRRFVSLTGYRDGLLGLRLAIAMAGYELRLLIQVKALLDSGSSHREHAWLNEAGTDLVAAETQSSPDLDLSIIIVSYNVRDELLKCLASIEAWLAQTSYRSEVIVVDNASHDGSADFVRRRFPETRIIELGANSGFAAANNRAVTVARGRYITFLNPDTTVVGDAFGTMLRYLDEHPDVGVVGPRLQYPDGSIQSTRRRFPSKRTGFVESTIVQRYWQDNSILRRYYMMDRSNDEIQDVDWLVGACLFTRRDTLDAAGLFDERFFMYSEEVEWCSRVHRTGARIVYLPTASIMHREGGSSKLDIPARQINFDTSKILLYETLHGRRSARVLRGFLLGSYLVHASIEAGKGLLGHKRPLRRERVQLYLRAFKSGLRRRSDRG